MIKETEAETEKRDEGGMTYRPLNILTVVLLSGRREGCPQIPSFPFAHFIVIASNKAGVDSQECLFGIIMLFWESAHLPLL